MTGTRPASAADPSADAFTDTIPAPRAVTLRKNAREEVRVSVDEFKGMQLLNIRVWFMGEDGTMRPGKQGVAVRLEMAADLARAIGEVCRGEG